MSDIVGVCVCTSIIVCNKTMINIRVKQNILNIIHMQAETILIMCHFGIRIDADFFS